MNNHLNNKKYIDIIDSARTQFWKHGLKRVTVEDICLNAKVSKMTFYKYFPNKIELAKTILDNIIEMSIDKMREIRDNDMTPAGKMTEIIKLKMVGSDDIGEEFLKDLYFNPESEIAQYMVQKTQDIQGELKAFYQAGKDNGWIRKDLNIDFLLSFITKSSSSITNGEFKQFFNNSQEMIMEVTKLFVYGMTPDPEY
jgi:AcrR family transcriptional regulator